MGLRFYRRVHFPRGSINFSMSGPSLSIGGRGPHITFGRRGVTRTVGIPGTGIYWTDHTGLHRAQGRPVRRHHVIGFMMLIAVLWMLFGHSR
jgi:hypothetical protein